MTPEKWKRIKEIFQSAVELPSAEVEPFLLANCNDDETMLAEVTSLLESHSASESLLESPALAVTDLVEDGARSSRIGQIIGAYKIESEIGRGGMGAVYLASRADAAFDKKVAIKLIKRGFDTDEIVRRFRYERQILAGLEHPNITRLLDGGSTSDGLPYLVMDFVDGKPLTRYSDEHKLSVEQRLDIFLQICSAVSYAHQSLVIHRDLKPSNILVTADGVPKLLDFGIAKLTAADGGGEQTFEKTVNAFQALTPEYASPEQVAGAFVTTASDIYSLGVILYELLTGHRPYTFRNRTPDEINRVLTDTSPTKPSSVCRVRGLKVEVHNPQSVMRKLQGDLDNIILMAVRKEPDRRYTSVEQFASDIRRYIGGLPVIAREDTFGYRASKFVGRNKTGVAAGVGIAASLIGGLIVSSRQAKIAARQRDRARREARKAEKVNRFLQKMLSSADPRVVGRDSQVTDILKIASESVEIEFARQPEIAADLHSTIGLTYIGLGDLAAAERHLQIALDLRRDLYPGYSVETAIGLHNYGKLLAMKGDLKSAEPLFLEALETLSRIQGRGNTDVANVLDDLGYLKALVGDNETAVELHTEELGIRRRILGDEHPDVARAMVKIANVHSVMGRYDLSAPLHREALRILRRVHGPKHPDVAMTMINLVRSILVTRPDEAEQLSREVLEMRRSLLGEEHPDVAWAYYNLAFVLLSKGDHDEAKNFADEALLRRGPNLPDEHPVVASTYVVLGRIHLARGDIEHALSAFETCLDLRLQTLPSDHWLMATTRGFIGECLVRLGNVVAGHKLLAESYDLLVEKLGADHEQSIEALERMQRCGARSAAA